VRDLRPASRAAAAVADAIWRAVQLRTNGCRQVHSTWCRSAWDRRARCAGGGVPAPCSQELTRDSQPRSPAIQAPVRARGRTRRVSAATRCCTATHASRAWRDCSLATRNRWGLRHALGSETITGVQRERDLSAVSGALGRPSPGCRNCPAIRRRCERALAGQRVPLAAARSPRGAANALCASGAVSAWPEDAYQRPHIRGHGAPRAGGQGALLGQGGPEWRERASGVHAPPLRHSEPLLPTPGSGWCCWVAATATWRCSRRSACSLWRACS